MKSMLIASIMLVCGLSALTAQDNLNNTDSLRSDNKRKPLIYGGFGVGYGNRGFVIGDDFSFLFPNNWGGIIGFKVNFAKSKDIPEDFYDYGVWRTPPYDYVFILSFNLVKLFPDPKNTVRYGIEAGPSWVNYEKADLSGYQEIYYYHHFISNTLGFSLRGKVEFMPIRSIGIEIAAYANINSVIPVIGIEGFFHFGRVRSKIIG